MFSALAWICELGKGNTHANDQNVNAENNSVKQPHGHTRTLMNHYKMCIAVFLVCGNEIYMWGGEVKGIKTARE